VSQDGNVTEKSDFYQDRTSMWQGGSEKDLDIGPTEGTWDTGTFTAKNEWRDTAIGASTSTRVEEALSVLAERFSFWVALIEVILL